MTGWPASVEEHLRPYKRLEHELVVVNDCICWGSRTVIPTKHRQEILDYLHAAHMGAGKMKGEARGYCWWPHMDADIERISKECRICSERAKETAKVPLSQWEIPDAPWKRLHMDFAGPFHGTMLLLIVDAMSKWPEVVQMKHATSDGVLEALRNLFSRYGACTEMVTDNGTQFTSQEFADFCAEHGIRHLRTPPGHPQSNGQAERYVQTFKDGITKLMADRKSLSAALREFLFRYRSAPHATTGKSPAELFLGRKLRSQLDLLVPVMLTTTESNRRRYQQNFDKRTKAKHFQAGDYVMVRDYRPSRTVDWQRGQLVKREGSRIWIVLVNETELRRHENQMRPRQWLHPDERAIPAAPNALKMRGTPTAPTVPHLPEAPSAPPVASAHAPAVVDDQPEKLEQEPTKQLQTAVPETAAAKSEKPQANSAVPPTAKSKPPKTRVAKTDTTTQQQPQPEIRKSGREVKNPDRLIMDPKFGK
ncbi:uncharacterized protein K02A2.6-like [Paramacrobiotus metropolitanus]|uniref:uncharacterized protein K02A2.6-like n=1 Tax=Paramacrobiotus metropolitanus TaxID=2943436 RepID=UPI00244605F5|nr:uncharacterized protein K02A2.6-like [Paramacrobiotus metropolitanus]